MSAAPGTDPLLESRASQEFERLFRLPESERRAATCEADQPLVRSRVEALLEAYDHNVADRFLEPTSSAATESIQLWLRDHAITVFSPVGVDDPETVGPFRIVRPIAQSDLSSIFLAEQTEPVRRTAAVKLLHSTARRRETLRRFDTERQAISAMRHPNVAQFFEAGVSDSGHAYFAMEYIDGPRITEYCAERDLPSRDCLRLFLQVCNAITHAHQRGIVHRDLKPSNILVSTEGEAGARAKVIDFGVAKAMERSDESVATMTGQVVGTLAYMSPEQLRGETHSIDTRSDIFSLGLVLFEMLAGYSAYPTGDSLMGTLRRAEDEPIRLRIARPELRGDLDTIVAKATALDPEMRYGSVTEFAADIERFLDGRPVLARNPGVVYIASKFVKRHWIATTATAVMLGAGAFAGSAVMQARSERSDLAMQVAQAWLEEVLESQRTIGEAPAREPKATKLVQQVRQFVSQLPGDPRAQAMLASAVTELGYVNLEKGRFDAAQQLFGEALAIRRDLAAIRFGKLGGLGDLSLALVRCGDAAGASGDGALRTKLYNDALEIDEHAAAAHPNDRMALSNLGWSCERIGVLLDSNDRARMDWLQRAIDAFSRLAAIGPSAEGERGLSAAYSSLAIMRQYFGLPYAQEAQLALKHGRAAVAFVPDDRHVVHTALKAEFVVAESQTDRREMAAQLLQAINRTEAFCDQDLQDKAGEELLAAEIARGEQFIESGEVDDATLQQFREAKARFRARAQSKELPPH